ncbi:MAG TPA: hypothetical protein VJZ00_14900 [Thermoanaerobaculia bacterium]|nr:hypothetical protein [Thermoanaerobaculia bacterium]
MAAADLPRLRAAVHRPPLELAVRVAHFEPPFEYLQDVVAGFSDLPRFVLNGVLARDPAAIAVRDFEIALRRATRLDEGDVPDHDPSDAYWRTHMAELEQFRRRYYPSLTNEYAFRPESSLPYANVDDLLDENVCTRMADYGFELKNRKVSRTTWTCHSSILSRRLAITFDKGSMRPSLAMSGFLEVESLSYSVSLGDPFFFSSSSFPTTQADDVKKNLRRFFMEYVRIFPHVIEALKTGITAADEVLATHGRRSV